jgi:hypothetical protein
MGEPEAKVGSNGQKLEWFGFVRLIVYGRASAGVVRAK